MKSDKQTKKKIAYIGKMPTQTEYIYIYTHSPKAVPLNFT